VALACSAYGQSGETKGKSASVQPSGDEKIEIPFIAQPPLDSPMANYPGFNPSETILPKGYTSEAGRMAFSTDTVYDRDVAVKLRDGTTIYVDIYRPVGDEKVPAIVCWGPAGKRGMNNMLDHMGGDGELPARLGIARDQTSGLQAWESPDPARWVPDGYALVNVDPRGVYKSEGDLQYFGPQDGRDGYDVVEWLAQQKWSNGKIGMNGNSWYAMTQWEIAAQRPPHLVAIAPWEGELNMYRDEYVRDGIPMPTKNFMSRSFGSGKIEDIATMIDSNPLLNSYWKSKIPDLSKIEIPVYVVASYGSQTHCRGSFDAFNLLATKDKWLRVHNTQEWYDLYNETNRQDLKRFFDHYLKGVDNDWESTPRVRLSVLDPGGLDVVNRIESEFPLARQEARKLYLDASTSKLSTTPEAKEDKASYNSEQKGKTAFTIRFDKETEITGYSKLRLWVEASGANDMDLYARIVKLDKNGKPLFQDSKSHKYSGPDGRLRVSLRKLDASRSTTFQPVHTFDESQPLRAGEIVPVEIQIWPTGMIFHPGQQLQLVVAGYDYSVANPGDRPSTNPSNKGAHIIHTGGKYDSYLLVPVIPNKNAAPSK
jgi:predicted acyl esterase